MNGIKPAMIKCRIKAGHFHKPIPTDWRGYIQPTATSYLPWGQGELINELYLIDDSQSLALRPPRDKPA